MPKKARYDAANRRFSMKWSLNDPNSLKIYDIDSVELVLNYQGGTWEEFALHAADRIEEYVTKISNPAAGDDDNTTLTDDERSAIVEAVVNELVLRGVASNVTIS